MAKTIEEQYQAVVNCGIAEAVRQGYFVTGEPSSGSTGTRQVKTLITNEGSSRVVVEEIVFRQPITVPPNSEDGYGNHSGMVDARWASHDYIGIFHATLTCNEGSPYRTFSHNIQYDPHQTAVGFGIACHSQFPGDVDPIEGVAEIKIDCIVEWLD